MLENLQGNPEHVIDELKVPIRIETTPAAWISVGAQTYHPTDIGVSLDDIRLKGTQDTAPCVVISIGPGHTSFIALGLTEAMLLAQAINHIKEVS